MRLPQRADAAGYLYAQAHLDRDAVLQRFEADVVGVVLARVRTRAG